MNQPFRFLHSSDFHLERPPGGLAEVPDHLRDALVDAPYRAAERVFDAAIKERVDFVLLAGDLFAPAAAGPRALVFLAQQFQRLAERGIQVYWSLGSCDDVERWGDLTPLADHVIRFSHPRVQRVVHSRGGQPLVQILGASGSDHNQVPVAQFRAEGGELAAVAVAHGIADVDQISRQGISYWALGGEHDRRALVTGPITAHYCGSPQGRCPQEGGAHGCTLVTVDEHGGVRTGFLATDAIRYQTERVLVDESTTPAQLHEICNQRIGELVGDPFGPDLLVHWTVVGSRTLAAALRRSKWGIDLIARLRADHGMRRPAAWTVGLESEAASAVSEELVDEETVLGEFLRTVRHYVENAGDRLSVEPYLAERHLAGSLGSAVALGDDATRQRVLAEVARLGVELLGPQEPRS